jgi:uncharacterized membrane protein
MFEFLFKYPVEFFAQGSYVLALPWWQLALLPIAISALAFFALGYFNVRGRTKFRDRLVIALLRGLAISLVVLSLSQPLLEVTSQVAQSRVIGVLLDNSISMKIRDFAGEPRSELIRQEFDTETGNFLLSLRQRFETRLFKFGEDTQAISDVVALEFDDGDSNLAQALDDVHKALKGQPIAGLVVISDGAIKSTGELEEPLTSLRAEGIPVYSIGIGQLRYQRDIEISQVKLPRRVLKGSRVIANVAITQRGYDGQTIELVVEDDGRILHKQEIRLEAGKQSYKVPLTIDDAGARQLKFYVANKTGEQIAANNHRQGMLSVDNKIKRFLYFEGEPRFELKFIRRAIADDENLAVTGLIRTADAKFYRVGIEKKSELRNGFPITSDELYSYDALILGSVEITLLSHEQQKMIVEFVSERGGALLMLGGRHAFAEGGYRDSLLHDISPVVLADQAQPEFSREVKIQPSEAGWVHPALLLADSQEKSMARWLTLPPLTIVNPIRQIKPGATLLLTSSPDSQEIPYVAMAFQRYGRGKVIAFPVQNSWIWQMHNDIDLKDQTHEILWRQLLRWLVEGVPPRLSLSLSAHEIHSGGMLKLHSEVLKFDSNSADPQQLRAVKTSPTGREQITRLMPHPSLPGIYEAEISAVNPGSYQLRVELDEQGKVISSDDSRFIVSHRGSEYYQSEMNEKLLRDIAIKTNGEFFSPDNMDRLLDALDSQQRGVDTKVDYELWDMPAIFLLLVLSLCAEWGYRRWRSLV